jgi:hypothetical protein
MDEFTVSDPAGVHGSDDFIAFNFTDDVIT